MTSTENTTSAAITDAQPWFTFLSKTTSTPGFESFDADIPNMIKDFLLSDDVNAVSETANKIDTYSASFDHLTYLFETIFGTTALLPSTDPKQEKLLQLIIELLKIPVKTITATTGETIQKRLYDNKFFEVKDDMWNAMTVDPFDLEFKTQEEYTQACIEYVNLSAFFARCIAAGLEDDDSQSCKFPSYDIPEVLESEHGYIPGIDTDFKVMIATQYIIISGKKMKELSAKLWEKDSVVWEKKLKELEDGYENGFPVVEPLFELQPGEKEYYGTGNLGMDVLGSVKAARKKLKELSGSVEEESEKTPVMSIHEEVAEKKDE